MQVIATSTDLRRAWPALLAKLSRDLAFVGRLARDPIGAFRDQGYLLSEEAANVLRAALP